MGQLQTTVLTITILKKSQTKWAPWTQQVQTKRILLNKKTAAKSPSCCKVSPRLHRCRAAPRPARVSATAHTHLNKMQREEKKAEILEATVSRVLWLWMVDSAVVTPGSNTSHTSGPAPALTRSMLGCSEGWRCTVQYSAVQCSTVQCGEMSHHQPSPARQAASDSPPVVCNLIHNIRRRPYYLSPN